MTNESFKRKLKEEVTNWKNEIIQHWVLIILSILLLSAAILLGSIAGNYVDTKAQTSQVHDLILDHIPVLDLDIIFIYGIIAVYAIGLIYITFFKVKKFHIVISQFSLLIMIRSFFIALTHLGRPEGALVLEHLPKIYLLFNYHNDLFFSAHTAVPFLAFLLFRKEKIGNFFLVMTFIMAATVLFMHVHYSIDVFSAFFITFGSYKIGEWFFKRIGYPV